MSPWSIMEPWKSMIIYNFTVDSQYTYNLRKRTASYFRCLYFPQTKMNDWEPDINLHKFISFLHPHLNCWVVAWLDPKETLRAWCMSFFSHSHFTFTISVSRFWALRKKVEFSCMLSFLITFYSALLLVQFNLESIITPKNLY